jgi:cobalt/nickel transport system permease protein
LRHTTFAQWSNQDSIVHAADARVKLALLLCFVVSLALVRFPTPLQLGACLLVLIATIIAARLPLVSIIRISLFSVPFVGVFAIIVYLSGDGRRAWAILAKSYLSALSVLVTTSSTPLPRLIAAGHYFRMPALLLEVTQVIYRYFFVIGAQAHQMQTSFQSRGGKPGLRALRASSGMIAVLFGRSYEKAVIVHQAMLGRGFTGRLPSPALRPLGAVDFALLGAGLLLAFGLHSI